MRKRFPREDLRLPHRKALPIPPTDMGRHWAMCIGIDRYNNLQSLQYAKRDAQALLSDDDNRIVGVEGVRVP